VADDNSAGERRWRTVADVAFDGLLRIRWRVGGARRMIVE
jgi:hypothetical protein